MKTKPFVTRANLTAIEEASPLLVDSLVYVKAEGELLTMGFSCALMWASFLHARKVDFWVGPDMDSYFVKYNAASDKLEIDEDVEGITKDCMATFNYLCAVAAEKLTYLFLQAGQQAAMAEQAASEPRPSVSAEVVPEVVENVVEGTAPALPESPAEVPVPTVPEVQMPEAVELPPPVELPAEVAAVPVKAETPLPEIASPQEAAPIVQTAPDLSVQRAMLEQEEEGR